MCVRERERERERVVMVQRTMSVGRESTNGAERDWFHPAISIASLHNERERERERER